MSLNHEKNKNGSLKEWSTRWISGSNCIVSQGQVLWMIQRMVSRKIRTISWSILTGMKTKGDSGLPGQYIQNKKSKKKRKKERKGKTRHHCWRLQASRASSNCPNETISIKNSLAHPSGRKWRNKVIFDWVYINKQQNINGKIVTA